VRFFDPESRPSGGWRARAYSVIFETESRAGFVFDVVLLAAILVSIVAISLETVEDIGGKYGSTFTSIEFLITGLFTVEYVMRLVVVDEPKRYAYSFMGIVDLLSLLPTYLGLVFDEVHVLQAIRALRLLRVFRIFQIGTMVSEGSGLVRALVASRYKIAVFTGTVVVIVVIQGALLYYLEHEVNEDFSSIPRSIYWAIVTLTTVGYGDISPMTVGGQFIASLLMLLGYGIIAVPTGIVTAEVAISELQARQVASHPPPPGSTHSHAEASVCAGAVPDPMIVLGPRDDGSQVSSLEQS
jgi:voltage-gated potassium channel